MYQAYCFMSVINRQVIIRIELTVSNAFNMSILSKAASLAMNDKTASIRDDNSDEQCPCENIQIRFPLPDPWVYMFRVEKRFRYGAIHSVRRQAGKIKVNNVSRLFFFLSSVGSTREISSHLQGEKY